MPLTLKQLLTSCHVGILAIEDLEPCAALAVGYVRPGLELGHYALQIKLADTLEKGRPKPINVVNVSKPGIDTYVSQQSSQFLLAIY